jgi:hypothetical protein
LWAWSLAGLAVTEKTGNEAVTTDPGYSHRQKAPLCLILYGSALLCFALAWTVGSAPDRIIAAAVGLLIVLLAPAFHHLTVVDQGDRLAVRFGPLHLFRRTVRYADIERVEVGRTLLLDGWGIHYSIRGGWVWNLWGRDCVVVHLKNGGVLRIGTDEAENLARSYHKLPPGPASAGDPRGLTTLHSFSGGLMSVMTATAPTRTGCPSTRLGVGIDTSLRPLRRLPAR